MRVAIVCCVSLLVLALTSSRSLGQSPELLRLRAAVTESPEDLSARCSLAFGLVREGDGQGALSEATVAITALVPRGDRASRRLLGACLYNRGRAHEVLADRASAIRDYYSSLAVRPNDTVEARLRTLFPEDGPDTPLATLVASLLPDFVVPEDARLTEVVTREGVRVSLVPSDRGATPTVAAVASVCGTTVLTSLGSADFDNYGTLGVHIARARRLGDLDAVLIELEGAGDATCGGMDGVMDFEHTETAVLFVEGCSLRVATFVTRRDRCEEDPEGIRVTFDAAGHVTLAPRGGLTPSETAGTFSIRDLAHPAN